MLPGQLIAFADALQRDQAWVRGGVCHHDYAFSLDAAVMPPEKLCNKFGSRLVRVTDWFYFLFLKYSLNTNRVPLASPAIEVERFYSLKRFHQRVFRPINEPLTCLEKPISKGF